MKKIISILLTILTLMSACILSVSANNSDTIFDFCFTPSCKYDFESEGRAKENATGTYIKYISGNANSAKFQVYGGNGRFWSTCTLRQNETKGGYAFVFKGQEGLISQYVYENRITHYSTNTPNAFLYGYVDVVDGGVLSVAQGLWSPDSVGTYTYFNR